MKRNLMLVIMLLVLSVIIFSCSEKTTEVLSEEPIATEIWDIIIDDGVGNGTWKLELLSDSTIVSSGSWIFDYGDNVEVSCDFVSTAFTFDNTNFIFNADGSAHHSGINQDSDFTLTVSGSINNGEGNGEYEIDFTQIEWESLDGVWSGTLNNGEGVTPIVTEPQLIKFEILLDYMDCNGMSFDDLLNSWIVPASNIVDNLGDYYIMDIRTSDTDQNGTVDYYDGHVPGAVLSSLSTIIDDASMANYPIIVVGYTGQTESLAVMALRLSGYVDAKVLKWGMSSWHSDFDHWTANCAQLNHSNWIAPPGEIQENEEFDYPTIDTDLEDGAEILAERVNALLSGGFQGLSQIDVLNNSTNYFINNFWLEDDVLTYGNISDAYRIYPIIIENFNPNETVVSYCWTGHTTTMLTAYLTVLGYDAKVLKFGVNSIIYDDLMGHKWSGSMNYDYEISSP